jgi:hypothetical protein
LTETSIQSGGKNFGAIDEYQKSWKIMINYLTFIFFPSIFLVNGRAGLNDLQEEVIKLGEEGNRGIAKAYSAITSQ